MTSIGLNAQILKEGTPPPAFVLFRIGHSLSWPISYRFFAGRHRTFHLLGTMPGWLLLPAASSLGRPLEPIIGIGALLLSDFVGYYLELRSRRAFIQRAARAV